MNIINQVSDLIDEIAMSYYHSLVEENKKVTYLTCLTKTLNLFVDYDNLSKDNLLEEDIEKIVSLKKEVESIKINFEELRKAVLLLEIKAYKHSNMALDEITPDAVGVIFTFLLDLEKKEKRSKNLFDITCGTGNLISVIQNYSKQKWHFIGVEQNIELCNYLAAKANFLEFYVDIHAQDTLEFNYPNVDTIIGDIPNYEYVNEYYHSTLYDLGVKDFTYLAIEKHLNSGNEHTRAYYLVDSNFFEYSGSVHFKNEFLKHAYFKAIIVLPQNFFQGKPKMILVVDKRIDGIKCETNIFTMPNYQEQDKWQQTLVNIKNYLEE